MNEPVSINPLFTPALASVPAVWRLAGGPEPTNLIALWPGNEPPDADEFLNEIAEIIADDLGEENVAVEILVPSDDSIHWFGLIHISERESPLSIWAQAAQPMSESEWDALGIPVCTWAIGVEGQLDPYATAEELADLLILLGRVMPRETAVLDVNTTRWHARPQLDALMADGGASFSEETLWIIHVVRSSQVAAHANHPQNQQTLWLHTHGMWRCGRPELEMLDVPIARGEAAAHVLNNLCGLLLEQPVPDAGEPFEIGPDLRIALQPWREVARYLPRGAPGGLDDPVRNAGDGHDGVRAAVCGSAPQESCRQVWNWSESVVEAVARGNVVLYQSAFETERHARAARAHWPQFVDAFAKAQQRGVIDESDRAVDADTNAPSEKLTLNFLVKARFTSESAALETDPAHEHLWFRVIRPSASGFEGMLMHTPHSNLRHKAGEICLVDREQISGWVMIQREVAYGPEHAHALSDIVAQAAKQQQTTNAP